MEAVQVQIGVGLIVFCKVFPKYPIYFYGIFLSFFAIFANTVLQFPFLIIVHVLIYVCALKAAAQVMHWNLAEEK